MLDQGYLLTSLLWGSIGTGCIIYGRKQGEWTPALTGVALIVVSYLIQSPIVMSIASIGLLFAMRLLTRRGY